MRVGRPSGDVNERTDRRLDPHLTDQSSRPRMPAQDHRTGLLRQNPSGLGRCIGESAQRVLDDGDVEPGDLQVRHDVDPRGAVRIQAVNQDDASGPYRSDRYFPMAVYRCALVASTAQQRRPRRYRRSPSWRMFFVTDSSRYPLPGSDWPIKTVRCRNDYQRGSVPTASTERRSGATRRPSGCCRTI